MRTRPSLLLVALVAALLAVPFAVESVDAQPAPQVFGPKPAPVQTQKFDGLAEGPFNRLVIRNVMEIGRAHV